MREQKNLREPADNLTADDYTEFNVLEWRVDEENDCEGPVVIDTFQALSEAHARIVLRNGIRYTNKYSKGAWLDYILDGQRIELDAKGRIPA